MNRDTEDWLKHSAVRTARAREDTNPMTYGLGGVILCSWLSWHSSEWHLFPGYLFGRLNGNMSQVLDLPGLAHILPFNLTRPAIDDSEISSLKLAVDSQLPISPIHVFQRIRCTASPHRLRVRPGSRRGRCAPCRDCRC